MLKFYMYVPDADPTVKPIKPVKHYLSTMIHLVA